MWLEVKAQNLREPIVSLQAADEPGSVKKVASPATRTDGVVRVAILLWSILLLAVCGRSALQPRQRNLMPTWIGAGADWLAHRPLYSNNWEPSRDQFRYGPAVAANFVPLALLPERLANVVWRLLNAFALLGGFFWWLSAAAPRPTTARQRGVLVLLLVPLALASLNNGQPNPLLIGLILAGFAALASRRWNLAALCLAASCVLKVYPLALVLLLLLFYPARLGPRFLFALLLLAALPFLLQSTDYVTQQYESWWSERLRSGDQARRFWPPHAAYRDLWLLLRVLGVPLSLTGYEVVQGLLAVGTAGVCLLAGWRGREEKRTLLVLLTLGLSWLMLCGPATESSTYILFAPVLAWGLVEAWNTPWPRGAQLLALLAGLLFLACVLAGAFPGAAHFHGLAPHPLAVLLYLGAFLSAGVRSWGSGVSRADALRCASRRNATEC